MSDRPLSCEEVLEHLLAFLDRELDAAMSADIERHLESCRGCFTRAQFEQRLKARLRETTETPAPVALHERIKLLLEKF